jgi:hypothetical protein
MNRVLRELSELRQRYTREEMNAAMEETLTRENPSVPDLWLVLDRLREKRRQPPRIAMTLSSKARAKDVTVTPHPLGNYDVLMGVQDDDE